MKNKILNLAFRAFNWFFLLAFQSYPHNWNLSLFLPYDFLQLHFMHLISFFYIGLRPYNCHLPRHQSLVLSAGHLYVISSQLSFLLLSFPPSPKLLQPLLLSYIVIFSELTLPSYWMLCSSRGIWTSTGHRTRGTMQTSVSPKSWRPSYMLTK